MINGIPALTARVIMNTAANPLRPHGRAARQSGGCTMPAGDAFGQRSAVGVRRFDLSRRSNRPTVAPEKAPRAVSDAALTPLAPQIR
jgi:hypothetical protein